MLCVSFSFSLHCFEPCFFYFFLHSVVPSVLQWCTSIAPGWKSLCRRRGWSTKRQKKVTLMDPKHDAKGWTHYPAPTFLFKIRFGKMSKYILIYFSRSVNKFSLMIVGVWSEFSDAQCTA